jgi:hypothetical protein
MSFDPGADVSGHVTFAGVHATLEFDRPYAGVVAMKFTGYDIGEFGTGPFEELERDLRNGVPIEIFLDARDVRSASIEVSSDWAHWMMAHRSLIYRFNMLCRSSFVQMTAGFVQRFTQFAEQMRIYHDAEAFELALGVACGLRIQPREPVASRSLM